MRYKIYKDSELVNTIVADKAFVAIYCEEYGFTYEEDDLPQIKEIEYEPTQLDIIEAQVTYTAMMTNTLLEV